MNIVVFKKCSLINFLSSKNCESRDCGNGLEKSQIWSWKVMKFCFQDFVGTLNPACINVWLLFQLQNMQHLSHCLKGYVPVSFQRNNVLQCHNHTLILGYILCFFFSCSLSVFHDESRVSREIIGGIFPGVFLGEVRIPIRDLKVNTPHRAW